MQFTAVALAALAATTVSAYSNATYVTEVYTAYTTVCPAATQLTFNGVTYTVSEATTLTITNCPCTVVKPVVPTSVVAPVYPNSTYVAPAGTGVAPGTPKASTVPASGANKAFALSGASLAGLLGLAAYIL